MALPICRAASQSGGVDFGSAQLLWYERLGETPDWISIGLNWKVTTHADITATLALVAPASHLFGGPGPITQLEIPVRSAMLNISFIPLSLPFGTYYVRVQVGNALSICFPFG